MWSLSFDNFLANHLKILFLLFLLFRGSLLYGQIPERQVIDSLKVQLSKKTQDSTQVNILNKLSEESYNALDNNSAKLYAEKALKMARQIGFKKGIAKAYINLAFVYARLGKYFEAKEYFLRAKAIFAELNDEFETAYVLLDVGRMFYNLGNYPAALEYYLNALTYAKKSKDSNLTGKTLNNLGNVYFVNGDNKQALIFYLNASEMFEKAGNQSDYAISTQNIAMVYDEEKNLEKSLEYYKKALKINETIDNKHGIARSYLSIGKMQMERKDYDTALVTFVKAQDLFRISDDKEYGALSVFKIGQVYLNKAKEQTGSTKSKQQDLLRAISILETSNESFSQMGLVPDLMKSSEYLSEAYTINKQFDKALYAYKLHIQAKDSLFNEENTQELTRIEMNYEFEKKQNITRVENEKEIAIRDATLKANKREKWFLFSGLLGLFIIGAMLFRIGRIRKKNNNKLMNLNSELEEANQIKMRFVAILNHDLRGPVASLIHFLHLKKNSPELFNEEAKERLELKTMTDAENLLATMEDLLLWSKGQMDNFRPHPARLTVSSLFKDIERQFSNNDRISFRFENPNNLELFSDENYLKTILRNLTSNAVKILENTESPIIIWKALGENSLTKLSITDNGRGSDESKFKALYDDSEVVGIKSGMGFHLIRDLAKAINCAISVNSKSDFGTEIVLKF